MITIKRVFARLVLGKTKFNKMMADLKFQLVLNHCRPIRKQTPKEIESKLFKKYRNA